MFVHRRWGWEIPTKNITPEAAALDSGRSRLTRRATASLAVGFATLAAARASRVWAGTSPSEGPAKYPAGRSITPEQDATTYNNYYEFGSSKSVVSAAAGFTMSPWSIQIDGMVKQPRTVPLEDLLHQVALEDRVYRHRCVEAWAMTVPWTGFPLAALLRLAEPEAGAKYVVFQSAADKKRMPGLRQAWYPWPYVEGVTMAEASNDLAFLATGLYGKPLLPQNGGPIRLVLPWKYGFKSAKAITRVTFSDTRPKTFWSQIGPGEYGFWANVNPDVAHPRWSQAHERLLGTGEMVPTQIFNGYSAFVDGLYSDTKNEKLFM